MVRGVEMAVYDAKYDLNKDGVIDDADFDIFQSYFMQEVDPYDPMSVACDFNGDGIINISDYGLFAVHYGAKRSSRILWVFIPAGILALFVLGKKRGKGIGK